MGRIIKSLFFILVFAYLAISFVTSNAGFTTFNFRNVAYSQELSIKEATESSNVKSEDKKVEYQLPYPGLLPDNPLYFLKALRDAVIDFLISDSLKKADFYLLQADKRLNAGVYLFKIGKEKYSLAESTISKGENYFEKALAKAKDTGKQGMDIDDIASRLLTSSKKHQEVIKMLEKNADSKTKQSLRPLLKRVNDFEKQAKSLIPK